MTGAPLRVTRATGGKTEDTNGNEQARSSPGVLSAVKIIRDDVWEHDHQKGLSSDRVSRESPLEEVASKPRPRGCDNTSTGLWKGKRMPRLGI